MKVVFEKSVTSDVKTSLNIETCDDGIFISVEYLNYLNRGLDRELGHHLTKEQLKEFIGALLHIQSKNRK